MTPSLQAKLDSGLVTLCRVWRVTRVDGVVLRFTDHDADVTANAQLFAAGTGLTCSAIELTEGLEPTNLEVTGIFDDAGISVAEYLAGKYGSAKVELGFADWQDPAEPIMWLLVGTLGQFKRDRLSFTGQLAGIAYLLDRGSAEATTPCCRAQLGDARCAANLTPVTYAATVTAVTSRRIFTVSIVLANEWLTFGKATFTSGVNVGRAMEIKRQTAGLVELYLPMPGVVAVGDAVTLVAGCDLQISTCAAKFNNVPRLRGEPYVPGADSMTENQKNFV